MAHRILLRVNCFVFKSSPGFWQGIPLPLILFEWKDKGTAVARKKGITGEVFLQLLESRLDNAVFRMGFAPTRRAARQLVNHKHVKLNGVVTNIPSCMLKHVLAIRCVKLKRVRRLIVLSILSSRHYCLVK